MKTYLKNLKKYPEKILMFLGIIFFLIGVITSPNEIDSSTPLIEYSFMVWLGVINVMLGAIFYFIRRFRS